MLAATFIFAWPMFSSPTGIHSGDGYRDNDWLNCRVFDLMSAQSIKQWGQFPLRSHLVGGGFPTITHPSDGSWAVTLIPVLLLGDVLGVKVNILLFLLLGCWGVYRLCRGWLTLGRLPALYAAAAFSFSGWLPSMLLVGFYNQLFFFVTPAALHLIISSRGKPSRLLWAGLLLLLPLQQGGMAFLTITFFIGSYLWLSAADAQAAPQPGWARPGRGVVLLLLLLLLLLVPLTLFTKHQTWIPAFVSLYMVALGLRFSPRMRELVRCLAPWAWRMGIVMAIALTLGAPRLMGLAYLSQQGGQYQHSEIDDSEQAQEQERYYRGPAHLLHGMLNRAPAEAKYQRQGDRLVTPLDDEYAWLGLNLSTLILAAVGVILGRRTAVASLLLLIFSVVTMGDMLPLDFNHLLTHGVPGMDLIGQPIKYFNFFILLCVALLSGAGLHWIIRHSGRARRPLQVLTFGLLLLPMMQNREIFKELFRLPVEPPRAGSYRQVLQVADASWLKLPARDLWGRIHAAQDEDVSLREVSRPLPAMEYFNVKRGVGTIAWYGTLRTEEWAVASHFVMPTGEEVPNPRYRGEAWTLSGRGRVSAITIRPNTIDLQVELPEADTVVINQTYLDGFSASAGKVVSVHPFETDPQRPHGFLGVRLDRAGTVRVRLTYKPSMIMAGLAISGLAHLAWIGAVGWLFVTRRRRRAG